MERHNNGFKNVAKEGVYSYIRSSYFGLLLIKIANNQPEHTVVPLRLQSTYPTNDVGLLARLSANLDYGRLLNYFWETNLFFNLRQMAIWPTAIGPFSSSPCDNPVWQMLNCCRRAAHWGHSSITMSIQNFLSLWFYSEIRTPGNISTEVSARLRNLLIPDILI